MTYLPMGCHSEKSKAEGPAAGYWASPITLPPCRCSPVKGVQPTLGPCFPEHIPFLSRHPQNPRLYETSFHPGIQGNR